MAIRIRCDACVADHVVRFTRPSRSVFAHCEGSKPGGGEGLGTRLRHASRSVTEHTTSKRYRTYDKCSVSESMLELVSVVYRC